MPPDDSAASDLPASAGAVAVDEHLLGVRPQEVLLELTSRCNLRCIYCAVSQPDYVPRDLEIDRDEIVDQLVELGPTLFQISGHGESTMVKDWHLLAGELLKRGLALTMITHLNKPMSDEEIDVLARLKRITVSCDTHDEATYQRLRRGGRLERVVKNVGRIQASCKRDALPEPYISFNCTVTHINVMHIPSLVELACDIGLSGVALTNLEEYAEIPGVERPIHPSKVDPEGALEAVRNGARIAREHGVDFWIMGELEETLEDACGGSPRA